MDSIEKLIEHFRQFPGIGPRQAQRFVYFLLAQQPRFRATLSREITELGKQIEVCQSCFRFFPVNAAKGKLCAICSDPSRDRSQLLIVSRDADFETIEKSHTYKGLYFILGGAIPIMEKDPGSRIRSKEFTGLLNERKGLKEVILALNLTPEGEHTQAYIEGVLAPYIASAGLKVAALGRGLSTGLELEYSDSETIKNALKNRL